MDETLFSFNEDELTEEDLAILRAFDAMEDQTVEQPAPDSTMEKQLLLSPQSVHTDVSEMFVLFCTEADEDIAAMREVLRQLEPFGEVPIGSTQLQRERFRHDAALLVTLKHSAHKLKGTAAAIGCMAISTIAYDIEVVLDLLAKDLLTPITGFNALVLAVRALEVTLNSFVENQQESSSALEQLEMEYQTLGIDIYTLKEHPFLQKTERAAIPIPSISIDSRRFEQLVRHTEQLAELRVPLELAQEQAESALTELDAAQARLRYLETLFSIAPLKSGSSRQHRPDADTQLPPSSLIARILDEAVQRTGRSHKSKARPRYVTQGGTLPWDELEIDRYTETDILAQLLSEAIADVSTASAQVHAAFAQLHRLVQRQVAQAAGVRSDTLSLSPIAGFHEALQALLVRVGSQNIAVPFSHVQRIDYGKQERQDPTQSLTVLLGFPVEEPVQHVARPALVLQTNMASPLVEVDEIVGEIELVVKPLAPPLQRSGIIGTAIDGMSNILLIVDVPALMQHHARQEHRLDTDRIAGDRKKTSQTEQGQPTILIADDSVYMRKSLRQTLNSAGYTVAEARDGTEALQYLTENPPNILLLDVEMPNLDGYELLSIIHTQTAFATMKIVMLTSRTSDKYQQRAFELGIHAYLTKPCPQDILLKTLEQLLAN